MDEAARDLLSHGLRQLFSDVAHELQLGNSLQGDPDSHDLPPILSLRRDLNGRDLALRALIKTANAHSQIQSSQLNSLAPLHLLPLEVFTEIVKLSLLPYHDTYYRRLDDLVTISRHWGRVIRTSSIFWTRVPCCNWELVELALQRSETAPLSVDMLPQHAGQHATWAATPRRAELFCRHSARWGSATLSAKSWDLFSERLSLASLEHLRLEGEAAEGSSKYTSFDYTVSAPKLRHLEVVQLSVKWQQPLLSQLRHLHLSHACFVVSELLMVLSNCREHLTTLKLFELSVRRSSLPELMQKVNLPILSTFTIHASQSAIRTIFSFIRATNCKHVYISDNTSHREDVRGKTGHTLTGSLAFAGLHESFSSWTNAPRVIEATVSPTSFILHTPPEGTWSLNVDLGTREDGGRDLLTWMLENITSRVPTVRWSITSRGNYDVQRALAAVPDDIRDDILDTVHAFYFHHASAALVRLLEFLTISPPTGDDGNQEIRCKGLCNISLTKCRDFSSDLLAFVTSRYDRGSASQGPLAHLPLKLLRIETSVLVPRVMGPIRSVLGADAVEWIS